MGTGNFYYKNILAVIPDSEQEWFDESDLKRTEDAIYEAMHKEYGKTKLITLQETGKYVGASHSYGGKSICRLFLYLWNKDYVWFDIIVYNGYYQGLNIDYEMNVEGGNEYDDKHLLNHPAVIKAEKTITKIIRKETHNYKVKARFSSGETWYEKVE